MANLVCHDCGSEMTGPKHKKLCAECRLLKDIEYWRGKTGVCVEDHGGCGKKFTPIRRGDLVCGDCSPGMSVNEGSCKLCGHRQTYRLFKEVAVCERCARDAKQRIKFIGGMRKRRTARREDSGWQPPVETEVAA